MRREAFSSKCQVVASFYRHDFNVPNVHARWRLSKGERRKRSQNGWARLIVY